MPTYPVFNKVTGEKQELFMNMAEYDKWRKENPDWDKDWSAGVASAVSGVGDFQNKTDGGWNEVLHKVSKVPGSVVKPYK
jgi:uncharacterized FlgJ-related protein